MPPEYTSYLVSPHARVDCVDCQIGEGFITERITRKAGDLKHITASLFKMYEYPIEIKQLRPAGKPVSYAISRKSFQMTV